MTSNSYYLGLVAAARRRATERLELRERTSDELLAEIAELDAIADEKWTDEHETHRSRLVNEFYSRAPGGDR